MKESIRLTIQLPWNIMETWYQGPLINIEFLISPRSFIFQILSYSMKFVPVSPSKGIEVANTFISHRNHNSRPMHIVKIDWYENVFECKDVFARNIFVHPSNVVIIVYSS